MYEHEARKDFAQFLLETLIDIHLLVSDPNFESDISPVSSQPLTTTILHQQLQNLFRNLQDIILILQAPEFDEHLGKYLRSNISVSDLIACPLFALRLLTVNAPSFKIIQTMSNIYQRKKLLRALSISWIDSNEQPIISIRLAKKVNGLQYGGQVLKLNSKNSLIKKWYFKTHQNGSKVESSLGLVNFSPSISSAHPVLLNEPFIYKVFELLNFGPKVHFISNPFLNNEMFIVTDDLKEDFPNFKIARDFVNDNNYNGLNPTQKEDLKIKATVFDLLNRIFMLNDMNETNYGITDDLSIKIVDFRAPIQFGALFEEQFLGPFLKVNGIIYPNTPRPDKTDRRLVPSILKQSCKDKKQKIKEGIIALELIDRNQLERALQQAKDEINVFINGQDDIASCQIAEHIGVNDITDAMTYLGYYVKAILMNYDMIRNCLPGQLKRLEKE